VIPKVIHYIWIGGEMPALYKKCVESWFNIGSDFKFEFWDEKRISEELVVDCFYHEMIKQKKYAFAVDYIRCHILHAKGGIYLDVDMEMIKDISPLLDGYSFVAGFESPGLPSCGIIGATKNSHIIAKLRDGVITNKGLVEIPRILKSVLELEGGGTNVDGNYHVRDAIIYSEEYFYPYNPYRKDSLEQLMYMDIKENTYLIHHWGKSWKFSVLERLIKKINKLFKK